MQTVARLAFIGVLTVSPHWALAADSPPARCVNVSVPKDAISAHHGRWIELTPQQWQFLRGIYAMNPLTPPGLPYGDRAALAQVAGDDGGLVFFIDGDRACTPMAVPHQLMTMIVDVATDTIPHEANGL